MKKWVFSAIVLSFMTACSSPESRRIANDSYTKNGSTPYFTSLDTAGLKLVGQDHSYQLPITKIQHVEAMDIRPPTKPLEIIGNSIGQFDGERASIVYPANKRDVYNLQQVQRLLTEQGITFQVENGKILTDWVVLARDDEKNTQVRYLIEEIGNTEANALVVSISDMKRDDIVTTPSIKEKELYASGKLNQLIGSLNHALYAQQQDIAIPVKSGPIQAGLVHDMNNHLALAMSSTFDQSWRKLADVLPILGFDIKEETEGRGHRLMKYKAIESTEWAKFGTAQPDLDNGEYNMQLSAYGNQSAVVIMDKNKIALSGEQAERLYQAMMNIMTK